MTTLEADDLLFDREDIRRFFTANGISVTEGEISGILKESIGYPLGIAVTARCMAGGKAFSPETAARAYREVFTYFEAAIYRRFDLPMRRFLLELAPFERFSLEMARMVSGDPRAGALLDWLLSSTTMWGCYYAHCENDLSARDKLNTNTTIFGHSASNCDVNGPKFTKLYRYMDADYVKANPYIYLSVDGEDLIFQITALFITDIEFDYIDPNPTGNKLTEFFRTVERKNWLDFDGVSFSEGDTILTLSTCCRKYDATNSGNQRLVVMAKLLPAGAEAREFSVSLTADPEMP